VGFCEGGDPSLPHRWITSASRLKGARDLGMLAEAKCFVPGMGTDKLAAISMIKALPTCSGETTQPTKGKALC